MTATTAVKDSPVGFDRSRLIFWGIFALTTVMVVGPIAPIIVQAFLDKPIPDLAMPAHRMNTYLATAAAMDAEKAAALVEFNDDFYAFSENASSVTATYYYAERAEEQP